MEIKLSENIRALRKTRGLTQEQLAEALNVSIGVISKWELGLSTPDLHFVFELANFFEISIDALLGYQMQDFSKSRIIDELRKYIHSKNVEIPFSEIEKSIKKYPNDFNIIFHSAEIYALKGVETRNRKFSIRALDLYKQASILLLQNTDPEISITSINLCMAHIYCGLGQKEKAAEILMNNNPCGVHNALIGEIFADVGDVSVAKKYLSNAILQNLSAQLKIAFGLVITYIKTEKYQDAIDVVHWIETSVEALKLPGTVSFTDKIVSGYVVICAYAYMKLNNTDFAISELCRARDIALKFDMTPSYSANHIRFVEVNVATAYDNYGETALEGVENMVREREDPSFSEIWEAIKDGKQKSNQNTH